MRIVFFILFLSCSHISFSQAPKFYADVDARKVLEGSYVHVEFVLKNAEGTNFRAPSFSNFQSAGGLSQGSSVSIINGKVSKTFTYSYDLVTAKPGNYTIGSAEIEVNGKKLKTAPIEIQVVKREKSKGGGGEDMFVRLELSDSIAYTGQQIVLDLKLYTKLDVRNTQYQETPEYDGFFVQDIRNIRANYSRVIHEGEEYFVKSVDKVALFPQQTGTYSLGPYQLRLGVAAKGQKRNFFFGTQLKYYNVISNSITLVVKNVNIQAPTSFSGAIGKYQMSTSVNRRSITLDDAFTVNMQIIGDGDGRTISAPIQNFSDDLDVYDPNVSRDESYESNGKWINKKTFEYLIVPKKKGSYTIKPEFSYYDVDSNKFITIQNQTLKLMVAPGSGATVRRTEDEKISKEELAAFATTTNLHSPGKEFFNSPFYWILFTLGILAISYLFYKRWKILEDLKIDPLTRKRNAAKSVAEQRLAKSNALIESANNKEAFAEISNSLKEYLSDKWLISYSELNNTKILNLLDTKGIDQTIIAKTAESLSKCEMSIYAGGTGESAREVYAQVLGLVDIIEEKYSNS